MGIVVTVSNPGASQVSGVTVEEIVGGPPGRPGDPGPAGKDGADGAGADATTYAAGQILSGQRVVIVGEDGALYYADCTNLAHINRVLGITAGAVIQGDKPTVRTGGTMTEPSWNWDLTKFLYLSTEGYLTQTPPSSGFILQMGWPISAKSIMVDKKEPLILA